MNLYVRIFLQRTQLRSKLCYIILFTCYLVALFLCFGPFLTLVDEFGNETVLSGFSFLSSNEAGNFMFISISGLVLLLLILLLSGVMVFRPGIAGERNFFFIIAVLCIIEILAPGILSLYWAISFAIGTQATSGTSMTVEPCAWIYLGLVILVWIPFFILHRFQLGGVESQPVFGTFLDEDSAPGKRDEGDENSADDSGSGGTGNE